MLRPILYTLAAAVLTAQTTVVSCDYDDYYDDDDFIQDVTVDITGDSDTPFGAFFEDDDRSESLSSTVPFSAHFDDQEYFFRASVDKHSAGAEQICVRITTPHHTKSECTDLSYGHVAVKLDF
jgi:hypothetical protein